MRKSVKIDADLYARAAAAAAREGKHVETYINELIRLQIREAERMHEIDRAFEEIAKGKVLRVGDLSDAEMNAIMQAKVPPEHDYEYQDDKPDDTPGPTRGR